MVVEILDLQSPKIKVSRAKTILGEVQHCIDDFLSSTPCDLLRGPHEETPGEHVILVKVGDDIPQSIPAMVGDVIHNARSALDHVACCLASQNGARNTNGVSFPFSRIGKDHLQEVAKNKIKKLSKDAQEAVLDLQPYRGGNHPLWILHELDLIDKHRALLMCGVVTSRFHGEFSSDYPIKMSLPPIYGSLKEGIHLFTIPEDAEFNQKLQVDINVGFNELVELQGQPVIAILNDSIKLVESIISSFEARFFS